MNFDWGSGTRGDLIRLGEKLDTGQPAGLALAEKVLKIRNRLGRNVALAANPAQRMYEEKASRRNIVLKARQMGVTTWIAGQFFLHTITHPGTVTVQVAHTQEAAEQIFRIVHRFLALLPESLCAGALKNVQRSAQRMVFPELDSEYLVETAGDRNAGRGLTITNLHCT
ncbi:MAG: terminase, partial [Acidobacteriaceae bacterium]